MVDNVPRSIKNKEARQSKVDASERNPGGRRTIIRNQVSGQITQHGSTVAMQQTLAHPHQRKKGKGSLKLSTIATYTAAFILVVALIWIGYQAPQEESAIASDQNTSANVSAVSTDEVVAAKVASDIADLVSLPIAANVAELSVSTEIAAEFAQTSEANTITKPQILELTEATRSITSYTVKETDTLAALTKQFGVSEDTIKWENDMTTSTLTAGTSLKILPTTGISYVVAEGDTVASIADAYQASASRITVYNDLDTTSIKPGLKIIIPEGVLPTEQRPGYAQPQDTFITGYSAGFNTGRTWYIGTGTPNRGAYAYGNCTAYVFDRRAELGRPVGERWGNAGTWAQFGLASGYAVNRTPAAGAVIQDWGHVGIVEEVLPNGDLRLSEMNAYVSGGGWNIVSGRILPAANVGQYLYIH